jgi:preprotein translocase subunit SecG
LCLLGSAPVSPYIQPMDTFLLILAIICVVLVVASLVTGIVGMARGGEFNEKWGNKLMRSRVFFQVLAVAFLLGYFALTT